MPATVYPAAVWDPGMAAGYHLGRTSMVSAVGHFTVGTNSRALIRDGGLCQWLIGRDGTIWQFCEADALCYQAGQPYNSRGPGIEIEYLDEPEMFTPAARTACSGLIRWLNSQWGVPLVYYDAEAPRLADWAGFIAHRSVVEDADLHHDYWPRADWDLMTATPPASRPGHYPGDTDMGVLFILDVAETNQYAFVDEFRVAGFPRGDVTKLPADIPVIKTDTAGLNAEVAARAALAQNLAGR